MPIRITFSDGDRAGHTLEYADDVDRIAIGRDPAKCRIVFPPDLTAVGREHCALRRVVGRYRLVLSGVHAVLVNGNPARDDQELPVLATVQIGGGGPVLQVETIGNIQLPDTMGVVGASAARPPGRDTMVRGLDKSLKRTKIIAAVAFLLIFGVLGAVLIGWWATQRKMAELNERQATVIGDLMADMQTQKDKPPPPKITDALQKGTPSVYLVVMRDDKGHEVGCATAWVVAKDMFATNAHVASNFTSLRKGWTLIARSNATAPKDFVINRVKLHPGYDEFQKIWADYKPTRDSLGPTIEQLQQILACDVALMWVESSDGLAAPLELAEPKTVEALAAGDAIGFVGYPMESMAMGGVNVKQPTPTMQVGNVTAMTDFFMMKSSTGSQLIQNSLPIMGGASGSPILNIDGKVVGLVSAANLTANPTGGGRISTGAGVNFGQRVDLLAELIDNKADEVQTIRSGRWKEDIKQFVSLKDKIVDVQVQRWMQLKPGKRAEKIATQSGSIDTIYNSGTWTYKFTQKLPAAGDYYVVAVGSTDSKIFEFVFNNPGSGWTNDQLLASDRVGNWYSQASLTVNAAKSVEVVVSCATKGVPVTVYVYQAK